MRYPAGTSNQDFLTNWYNAQGFGVQTSYGYHEGDDFNIRTGGDTDLGKPLVAVADGTIVYWHNSSHPTSGFGRHIVLKCNTSKGLRWYMYSHCQDINTTLTTVKEGDIIGHLGKSGTTSAHLHFSVFKVDPNTLYNKIDSIAHNQTELNASWEKFELLSAESNEMAILTYLGVATEDEAKAKLREHLGEKDAKCDWGNADPDRGGYLGSERRNVARLEAENKTLFDNEVQTQAELVACQEELAKTQTALTECQNQAPIQTEWVENGKIVETTDGNTKTIINYAKKAD